jgi:hypothetical protein
MSYVFIEFRNQFGNSEFRSFRVKWAGLKLITNLFLVDVVKHMWIYVSVPMYIFVACEGQFLPYPNFSVKIPVSVPGGVLGNF